MSMNNDAVYTWYICIDAGSSLTPRTIQENTAVLSPEPTRQWNLLTPNHSSIWRSSLLVSTSRKTSWRVEVSTTGNLEHLPSRWTPTLSNLPSTPISISPKTSPTKERKECITTKSDPALLPIPNSRLCCSDTPVRRNWANLKANTRFIRKDLTWSTAMLFPSLPHASSIEMWLSPSSTLSPELSLTWLNWENHSTSSLAPATSRSITAILLPASLQISHRTWTTLIMKRI